MESPTRCFLWLRIVLNVSLLVADRTFAVIKDRLNAKGRIYRIFVLPNAHNRPSGLRETPIGIGVSNLIALDFLPPEICICFGLSSMQGTTMPKAAIDEYGNLFFLEYDICASVQIGQGLLVNNILQPERS